MSTEWKTPAAENGEARIVPGTDLPRLSGDAALSIVPSNLRALEALYYAAMLEEAGLFRVVGRLVAMFSQGLLPLNSGPAAEILYRCWKPCHSRLTAMQRHTIYARAFGLPCADDEVVPNGEFNNLWLRFLP